MTPHGGVCYVAAEEPVDGWRGEEFHLLTAIIAASETRFAGVADEAWLNGDAVADFKVGDGGVGGEDYAGGFVAEDVGVLDDHGADAAGVPEVDVRSVKRFRSVSRCWLG